MTQLRLGICFRGSAKMSFYDLIAFKLVFGDYIELNYDRIFFF